MSLVVASVTFGATIHVPGDEPTIQACIDAAADGDECVVAPGTYVENIDFNGKAISLRGSGGAAVTTIDGNAAGSVVTCSSGEGPATGLDGFTIIGGSGAPCFDMPTAICGGGMYNVSCNLTVTNCAFIGNSAGRGGGMSNESNSDPTLINCSFSRNEAPRGGAIYNSASSPMVTHCTFSANRADIGGAMSNRDSSSPTITNCILWDDVYYEVHNTDPASSNPTFRYSIVRNGFFPGSIDGGGNIDVDPLFVDADGADDTIGTADDDLRLEACSPAIDAANNYSVPGGITTDLDGNPRFVDDAGVLDRGSGTPPIVDMGAFERQVTSPPGVVDNVTRGTFHCSIQDAINRSGVGDEIVVPPGTYVGAVNFNGKAITLRSSGGAGVTTIDGNGAYHVVQCVSGEGPDTILDGFTITGGDATEAPFLDNAGGGMRNAGSSPTVTNCTFSGNKAYFGGGMRNDGSSPTVTNCTFSGNTGHFGGGMSNVGSSPTVTNCTFSGNKAGRLGGGMLNETYSSPTITNCTFSANSAMSGGGMSTSASSSPRVTHCLFSGNTALGGGGGMGNYSGSGTVTNCTFSGNTATFGGGMSNVGQSPVILKCTFTGNAADLWGGAMFNERIDLMITDCAFSGNSASFGGAIYNWEGSPTMTNCALSGNTASLGGGAMFNISSSHPAVINSILWGNSPDEVRNDDVGSDSATVSHSDVQGGLSAGTIDGGGNIDADPLFVNADGADETFGTEDDNLRLRALSPCIDAGDNKALGLLGILTDLDGNDRFHDDPGVPDTGNGMPPLVDMGAYEAQCGNGVVDAGEDCDDAGESLTCDADCTFPGCGDGVPNVTVGEECDDGGESNVCDTDCTVAECGDGTLNVTAGEECEADGETATCDIDCTVAECGDGTLNVTAGEECDDGAESVTCDIDCTVAECGDGTLNVTVGEECDDGNTQPEDGCDSTCQVDFTIIPTVSAWGLIAMTLLLLIGTKLQFRPRRPFRA